MTWFVTWRAKLPSPSANSYCYRTQEVVRVAFGKGISPVRQAEAGCGFSAAGDKKSPGQPVISVDTKKKELVGDFKNNGRDWRPKGCPEEVRVHDFLIKELGRAVPYGIYDLAANA